MYIMYLKKYASFVAHFSRMLENTLRLTLRYSAFRPLERSSIKKREQKRKKYTVNSLLLMLLYAYVPII